MTAKMSGVRYEFAGLVGRRSAIAHIHGANRHTTLTASYAPPPHASLSHSRLRKPRTLSGKIAGGVMPIAHMSVALRPATVTGKGCIWWSVKKHKLVRSSKGCGTPSLLTAKLSVTRGVTHWSLKLGAALQPGSYVLALPGPRQDRPGVEGRRVEVHRHALTRGGQIAPTRAQRLPRRMRKFPDTPGCRLL